MYSKFSTKQLADYYGVCAEVVRKKLHEYEIPLRKPGGTKSFFISKNELEELYQKYSMNQIAVILGVGETVVFKRIKEYGIVLQGSENGGHRNAKGKVFSDEHVKNLSLCRIGKNLAADNPNWKGGMVSLTCQQCGNPYHVIPARKEKSKYCSNACKIKSNRSYQI